MGVIYDVYNESVTQIQNVRGQKTDCSQHGDYDLRITVN